MDHKSYHSSVLMEIGLAREPRRMQHRIIEFSEVKYESRFQDSCRGFTELFHGFYAADQP